MLGRVDKALFYVRQTLENGWSRDMLLNMLGTDLYERSGKAQTNFKSTLLNTDSDLAQEITRDPYNFSLLNYEENTTSVPLKTHCLPTSQTFCWSLVQALLM